MAQPVDFGVVCRRQSIPAMMLTESLRFTPAPAAGKAARAGSDGTSALQRRFPHRR
jgi:hypothetical protein